MYGKEGKTSDVSTLSEKIDTLEKRILTLTSLFLSQKTDLVNIEIFMLITGWARRTVHTRASQGFIAKRGSLYSLKSFYEYQEIVGTRGHRKPALTH